MKYKLIIFDLDDTLIDTFHYYIPLELKNALQAMVCAGLNVKNFDKTYARLLEINAQSKNGHSALEAFLKEMNADKKYLDIAIESYSQCASLPFTIPLLSGAAEVLQQLKKTHILALVSKGLEKVQRLKLKITGLDQGIFKKISITPVYNKKLHYQQIQQDFKVESGGILVVGDKVEGDLLPAKELGMATVYIPNGRGAAFPPKKGEVDFIIHHLKELLSIVKGLKSNK